MDADASRTPRPRPQPRFRGRPVEVDYSADGGDGADPGRRIWPAAIGVAVVGLVLGLLAGLVYSASESTSYQATTSLSVLPDPNLDFSDDGNNNAISQDATAFIQSQLVVVNGAELADRVRADLGLASTPSVEATQVGQTYVVSIVATAASRNEALRVAQRTATEYDALRTSQLTGEVDSLLRDTNTQISTVSKGLTTARRNTSASAPLTPSQTALQSEYERLLSQRSALTGVNARADRIVTIVAPARNTSAGLSSTARDALIGALLGAIAGLALFIVTRRSVRRIRSVADVAALGLPALLPVQSRRPWRRRRGRGGDVRPDAAARLLAARLDPELTTGDPIAFVGATATAGADRVSLAVASALTDRGPVLYLPRRVITGSADAGGAPWFAGLDEIDSDAAAFAALLEPSDTPGVWLPVAPADPAPDTAHRTRVSRTAHLATVFRLARRSGFVVVIEADPVPESDMAVDCGRAGASIVLVVARDSSSPSDVVVATELFSAQSVTFLGAVLNEPVRLPGRLLAKITGVSGLIAPVSLTTPADHRKTRKSRAAEAGESGSETAVDTDGDTDVDTAADSSSDTGDESAASTAGSTADTVDLTKRAATSDEDTTAEHAAEDADADAHDGVSSWSR